MVYAYSRTPLNGHLVITGSLLCPWGKPFYAPPPPLSVSLLIGFDCISIFDDRVESFQFREGGIV